jgi:hypothetical protein
MIYSSSSENELYVNSDSKFYAEVHSKSKDIYSEEISVDQMYEGVHVLVE